MICQVDVFFVHCLILRCGRQIILDYISNGFLQALTAALVICISHLTSVSLYALLSLPLYVLPSCSSSLSPSLFPRFYYLHPLLLIHMPFCTNTSSSPFEVRHVRFSYDKPVLKVPCTCAVRFEDLVVVRLTILSGWYLCCVLACTVSQPR